MENDETGDAAMLVDGVLLGAGDGWDGVAVVGTVEIGMVGVVVATFMGVVCGG